MSIKLVNKVLILLLLVTFQFSLVLAQVDEFAPTPRELEEMNKAMQADSNLTKFIGWHGDAESLYYNYKKNLHKADSIWEADQKAIQKMNIGETEKFEIIPLVDWFTASDSLIGENGVSYLIRTDETTILFDLGLNAKAKHPSPLLHNMSKLGISMDDIDLIVLSHNHPDHVGGPKWARSNSFSIDGNQVDLNNMPVYTATEMTYPNLKPKHTPKPIKISKGVATIGVIHNPIFLNEIAEQALAINVKDKGIVVISGCGHQSIKKILERSDILFSEPLYGLIGGFHFPMEENRNISWIYKYFVVDKLPWQRLTEDDIYYNINLLKSKGVKLVGISGHDSCDKSIGLFKKEFGKKYIDLVVGKNITLND
ncbi:MAG: MBL fold metallo-hydrolase [Bacteroidales bacterium]|nr:MBL fold metallo-hydrolase [Bacteroidales bacterium]